MSHYSGSVPDTEPARKWLEHAACAGPEHKDHRDIWFPTPGDHRSRAEAVAVCEMCPVRQACLVDALREEHGRHVDTRHGIRGGLSPKQRRSLYEKQRSRAKKARMEQAAA